jgi:hypothetical protein
MSVLAEFKECQKMAFQNAKDSEAFQKASDRMDVLWIRLSMDEMVQARQYERQLWINSDKVE